MKTDGGWVLDLDGVVWLADTPIPGAAEAVARLRAAGARLVFVTNNSNGTTADVEAKLARHGIRAETGEVVTSAIAAARLLEAGQRVLVCGGPGVEEAVHAAGALPLDGATTPDPPADVVVVGFHREFDYERMRIAATAVRGGARLIATNDDATYPTPDGPIPGGGSILASIERASGVRATVAGKPYGPMVDTVRARLGPTGVLVGDRPDTDGRFARAIGYRFDLVLTGVTSAADLPVEPAPDEVGADLAEVVDRAIGAGA
jgi:HAD superfamily hydrolase (TIGR01450 family)